MTGSILERLLTIEPFHSMDPEKFPGSLSLEGILKNDTRLRRYRDGDLIVRQGDYGNSAFLILEGAVRVIKGLPQAVLGRKVDPKKSILGSIAGLLTRPRSPEVRDAKLYPQETTDPSEAADGDSALV